MDIKVITRHGPSNYGSLLQAIATIKSIESLGHNCTIINYLRKDERGFRGIITGLTQKSQWNNKPLKQLLYIFLRYPETIIAQVKFDIMRRQYLKMTHKYNDKKSMTDIQADVYMTGSDQVWGPIGNGKYDDAYFLSFVTDTAYKVSFSSSFGKSDLDEHTLQEYHRWLSRYNLLTVREDSAVKILNGLNLKCYSQVLDPTLLLDSHEWSRYIKKDVKGKYILIYQIHNNPQLDIYAKKFAEYTKLPLIRVSPLLHQITRGGKFVYLPDLGNFLSYIKNATYIITDSFHGTAFSINFNKNFIEILPNTNTGTRNQSILNLTGLQSRIVSDMNDFSLANRPIDYTVVNNIINNERAKTIKVLKSIIENKL